jgi:hypothetical protein
MSGRRLNLKSDAWWDSELRRAWPLVCCCPWGDARIAPMDVCLSSSKRIICRFSSPGSVFLTRSAMITRLPAYLRLFCRSMTWLEPPTSWTDAGCGSTVTDEMEDMEEDVERVPAMAIRGFAARSAAKLSGLMGLLEPTVAVRVCISSALVAHMPVMDPRLLEPLSENSDKLLRRDRNRRTSVFSMIVLALARRPDLLLGRTPPPEPRLLNATNRLRLFESCGGWCHAVNSASTRAVGTWSCIKHSGSQ